MTDLNIPSDIFDNDDIDSPIDEISEPVRVNINNSRSNTTPTDNTTALRKTETQAPQQTPKREDTAAGQAASRKNEPARERQQTERRQQKPAEHTTTSTSGIPQAERPAQQSLDLSVDLSFFTDGRFTRMLGLTLIFAALFMMIVAISYFSTGADDQSAIAAADGASKAKNAGGLAGALVANAFISQWLGIGSFLIIFLSGALGTALLRIRRFNIIGVTIKSLVSAIALSIVAGYISMHFVSDFPLGGMHGLYINSIVKNIGGEIGALLLSLLLVGVIAVIFIKELGTAARLAIEAYRNLKIRVATENEARRSKSQSVPAPSATRHQPETAIPAQKNQPPTEEKGNSTPDETAEPANTPISDEELHRPIVVENEDLAGKYAPAAVPEIQTQPTRRMADIDDFVVEETDNTADIDSTATVQHPSPAPLRPAAEVTAPKEAAVCPATEAQNINSDALSHPEPAEKASPLPYRQPEAASEPATAGSEMPGLTDIDDSEPYDTADDDLITDDDIADDTTPAGTPASSAARDVTRLAPEIAEANSISRDAFDPTAELSRYKFPSLDTLRDIPSTNCNLDEQEQEANKERIRATLSSFGIGISHIEATIGPTVTLYEVVPAEGVRISSIKRLEDDIARAIAAVGTRIIAPIPGKETIGIEVPNKDPQIVPLRRILASEAFQNCKMELPMAMGATISNEVYIADLTKMPHLLVAGATGTGKSVGLNVIISSLLFKKHPAELKFVLVDPKMVEFSLYKKLERHYLAKLPDEEEPIITDPHKVVPTLNSLCVEMDNRYMLLKSAYVRSIKEYNRKFTQRMLNPNDGHRYLPYIVVVVDEFADLIMMAGKEVEQPIARIAQKARAVGIHLILATQRPSTNVITGIIKANFPGRIAFRVFQMVDSRTILDRPGANQLIGRGDMLFSRDGVIDRVQCALIETEEVEHLCDAISCQVGYDGAYELPEYIDESNEHAGRGGSLNDADPLFGDAARYIITANQASTTSLQRRFEIGYPRAGKIMDQLEKAGVVGPAQGSKPRTVLLDTLSLERLLESMGLN